MMGTTIQRREVVQRFLVLDLAMQLSALKKETKTDSGTAPEKGIRIVRRHRGCQKIDQLLKTGAYKAFKHAEVFQGVRHIGTNNRKKETATETE